mmetsp:Transcript_21417/g.43254  ORF Transcript_21417/g.43254 Transcript_21417/m.43254 type:complete len:84 (+) Transcript_21417:72-323(+)
MKPLQAQKQITGAMVATEELVVVALWRIPVSRQVQVGPKRFVNLQVPLNEQPRHVGCNMLGKGSPINQMYPSSYSGTKTFESI